MARDTPSIFAMSLAVIPLSRRLRAVSIDDALADVCCVLPNADPIPEFRGAAR